MANFPRVGSGLHKIEIVLLLNYVNHKCSAKRFTVLWAFAPYSALILGVPIHGGLLREREILFSVANIQRTVTYYIMIYKF